MHFWACAAAEVLIGAKGFAQLPTYTNSHSPVTECVAYYNSPTAKAEGWCALLILRADFWSQTCFTGHRWTNLQVGIHLFARDVYTRKPPAMLRQIP